MVSRGATARVAALFCLVLASFRASCVADAATIIAARDHREALPGPRLNQPEHVRGIDARLYAPVQTDLSCTPPPRPWPAQFMKEDTALRSVFKELNGPGWNPMLRKNWTRDDVSHCCWNWPDSPLTQPPATLGVMCSGTGSEASVSYLGLSRDGNLTGTVPMAAFDLSQLHFLVLAFGAQDGGPGIYGTVPTTPFTRLPKLQAFSLMGNTLTGTIPDELFDLPIEQLFLSHNRLTGRLSPRIGRLNQTLVKLGLEVNQLDHHGVGLPEELYACTKLTGLTLYSNNFGGTISDRIGDLRNLNLLSLMSTGVSGTVPEGLWDTEGVPLEYSEIYLANNNLTGTISPRAGLVPRLWKLEMAVNHFHGTIPDTMWNATNLVDLQLWANRLTGTLSDHVRRLQNLEDMELATNQLHGTLPDGLFHLSRLQTLILGNNAFSGTVSVHIARLQLLGKLGLFNTSLAGPFPWHAVANISALANLSLAGSQFSGSIDVVPPNTVTLDIGNCSFSGALPELPVSTQLFVASNNNFGGQLPAWRGLVNLTTLLVGGNILEGYIPQEWAGMRSMQALSLAGCRLSGSVPAWLPQRMPLLESLVLLGNAFVGRLPAGFAALPRLRHFDVSMNRQLHGFLPEFAANNTQLEYFSARGCAFGGTVSEALAQAPALSTLCIDDNLLSCRVPWTASSLPATNGSSLRMPSTGVCQRDEVSILVGNAIACDLAPSVVDKVSDAGSYECLTATAAYVPRGAAGFAFLAVAFAVCAARFRVSHSSSSGTMLQRTPTHVQGYISHLKWAALSALGLAAIAAAAALINANATSTVECRLQLLVSLFGVRFDLQGLAARSAPVLAAAPPAAALVLWGAYFAVLPRASSRAESESRATRESPGDAREESGPEDTTQTQRASGVQAVSLVVGCLAVAIVSVVPNVSYVLLVGSTAVAAGVKSAASVALVVIKALINTVAIPRATKLVLAVRHSDGSLRTLFRQAFWLSLSLRLLNVVVVPVATVLILDGRCFYGKLHERAPSSVSTYRSFCYEHYTMNGHAEGCLTWHNQTYIETVRIPWTWDPSCSDAVVQRYGGVITQSLLLQGTVFLALRLVREVTAMRLRQRLSRRASERAGSHQDGAVDVVASLPGGRWALGRASWRAFLKPWHVSLATQFSGVVATLCSALFYGIAAFPPVAWAAAVSLCCQFVVQRWLAAQGAVLRAVDEHAATIVSSKAAEYGRTPEHVRTTLSRSMAVGAAFTCAFHALMLSTGAFAGTLTELLPLALPLLMAIGWAAAWAGMRRCDGDTDDRRGGDERRRLRAPLFAQGHHASSVNA